LLQAFVTTFCTLERELPLLIVGKPGIYTTNLLFTYLSTVLISISPLQLSIPYIYAIYSLPDFTSGPGYPVLEVILFAMVETLSTSPANRAYTVTRGFLAIGLTIVHKLI
jgi:hypothetical protein